MRRVVVLCAAALLAGCTTTNVGTDRLAERDPLEGLNRGLWGVNQGLDKVILKPVSSVYRTVAPAPARRGLSRVLANLAEPWSAINNLLQGKGDRAGRNLARFLINTTIGIGGLADHASRMGVEPAQEDFGQTMAAWGMNGGPYLVIPLLGPSTMRDGIGSAVAFQADPYRIGLRESGLSTAAQWGVTGFEFVSARAELTESGADAFLETSLDPYAAARSAFLQRRRAQILDQEDGTDVAPVEDNEIDPVLLEGASPAPAEGTSPAPAGDAGPPAGTPAEGATSDAATAPPPAE